MHFYCLLIICQICLDASVMIVWPRPLPAAPPYLAILALSVPFSTPFFFLSLSSFSLLSPFLSETVCATVSVSLPPLSLSLSSSCHPIVFSFLLDPMFMFYNNAL